MQTDQNQDPQGLSTKEALLTLQTEINSAVDNQKIELKRKRFFLYCDYSTGWSLHNHPAPYIQLFNITFSFQIPPSLPSRVQQ